MKKIKYNSEKGAISIFTMIVMVFFIITSLGIFMMASRRSQTQTESVSLIQNQYDVENENAVYNDRIADSEDTIPIYTKEQLWAIGSGDQFEIDGIVYTFSSDKEYELKNDIIINIDELTEEIIDNSDRIDITNDYEIYYYKYNSSNPNRRYYNLITSGAADYTDSYGNKFASRDVVLHNWTHTPDGVHVTDGDVTLEVGSAVTGYSVTANGTNYGDGNWYVLGAKDGKLLITTTYGVGNDIIAWSKDGYLNGVNAFNTEGTKFLNSSLADNARAMDVDDINRCTLYNPSTGVSETQINKYGNQVTYTLNSSDNTIHTIGTYAPTTDTGSSYSAFNYWNGTAWVNLASGESKTITSTDYKYYPQDLGIEFNSNTSFNGSASAYQLIFRDGSGNYEDYWLASDLVRTNIGDVYYGVRAVSNGLVCYVYTYNTQGEEGGNRGKIRPVVELKRSLNISSAGVISQ